MSENNQTAENEINETVNENAYSEVVAKVKKIKYIREIAITAAIAGATILAIRYLGKPVPEWANDSEDI